MKDKLFHTVYKTVNLSTGEYYYGSHSTDNLDDGYIGSGNQIRSFLRKMGRKNLQKTILFLFETRKESLDKERELIRPSLVDSLCLNLSVGRRGERFYLLGSKVIRKPKENRVKRKIKSRNPVPKEKVIDLLNSPEIFSIREIGKRLQISDTSVEQVGISAGINLMHRRFRRKIEGKTCRDASRKKVFHSSKKRTTIRLCYSCFKPFRVDDKNFEQVFHSKNCGSCLRFENEERDKKIIEVVRINPQISIPELEKIFGLGRARVYEILRKKKVS